MGLELQLYHKRQTLMQHHKYPKSGLHKNHITRGLKVPLKFGFDV